MIWVKTDAGRAEMQSRALVKDRARRNLLLTIDGSKSEEMLLSGLAGISAADFQELRRLGLIEPAPRQGSSGSGRAGRSEVSLGTGVPPPAPPAPPPAAAAQLSYPEFTAALTDLISSHLGLRGFTLSLAVEKASTPEELQDVAKRVLDLLRERKGDAVADAARIRLYGA